MKILTADIETSPFIAYEFDVRTRYIGPHKMIQPSRMICFAAKWYDQKRVLFHDERASRKEMVQAAWNLLDTTDVLVTYNGNRFDIPRLNQEFAEQGLGPPSPYRSVDLFTTVKSVFGWEYRSLNEVCRRLDLGQKVDHAGFQLWVDCLAGKREAWRRMAKYNRNDVVITEALHDHLLPWIKSYPNSNLYDGVDDMRCPRCKSYNLVKRGFAYTPSSRFQQYKCKDCGAWPRGKNALDTAGVR